eukprot:CAMPEP_0197024764 /NCGR_PEP_ID=MMETSP1384-20130603/5257_1 /TAXON_ID=29189 /ORGANISM="Ammonia sp." /LENGTH=619 /DNA_ID=CAMNT_0042453207 /DNA_START=314 /DNA_END=2173 /DNA_ORIENTATION=+
MSLHPFKLVTDIEAHCKFIENWNGLNTNQMRSLPKSIQEYENRAKNWLNGRRAINYAQNLFPEMILCAEHYAKDVAKKLFTSNMEKQRLYLDILIYAYIAGICSGRVALYDGHHRASLICENSIKKEGNLKRLLQKFFEGDEVDAYTFPKHLQDAIDYFKNKYHEKMNKFQTLFTHRNFHKSNSNTNTDEHKSASNEPQTNRTNMTNTNASTYTQSKEHDSQSYVSNMHSNVDSQSIASSRSRRSVFSYGPQRGGSYIGSSSQCRNNPMNIPNFMASSNQNETHTLPAPLGESRMSMPDTNLHQTAINVNHSPSSHVHHSQPMPPTNTNTAHSSPVHTNSCNNANAMNYNANSNNNTNANVQNIVSAYGLSSNLHVNNINNQMNTHRSSVSSLVSNFNSIRRRNAFLEQELKDYQEQQRLDNERIKLLEDQISLLQRQQNRSYGDDDYTAHSSPTSATQTNEESFPCMLPNHRIGNPSNMNMPSMQSELMPPINMNNSSNSSCGMNFNQPSFNMPPFQTGSAQSHPIANNNNSTAFNNSSFNNLHSTNSMAMGSNTNKPCMSPIPLQTLGLNFESSSTVFLPSTPMHSSNQSVFGGAAGEFQLDAADYSHSMNDNNVNF